MANKSKKTKSPKTKGASNRVRPSSSKKEANISKVGKSYRVRVSIDGERVTKSFKTQSDAIKYRDKAKEKQSKVIKVTKKVKLPKTKRKQVTKASIKQGKVKEINIKTGRKVKVKEVKVKDVKITKPQQKRKESNKSFHIDLLDGKVVPTMMTFAEDQQAKIEVRFDGSSIECDSDQLSELVNTLSSEYYDWARDNDIDSPNIKWRIYVNPSESIVLNLDESFFLGFEMDEEEEKFVKKDDENFDKGFYFFQWSNQF